jgi:hypothetical protein
MLRAVIALTALSLAALRLFRPDIHVDMTLLAFVVIAAIATFGPKFRIKALDLLGFKIEFPEQKSEPDAASQSVPRPAHDSGVSSNVGADTYYERFIKLAPTEIIGAYAVVMAMVQSPSNRLNNGVLPWAVFAAFLVITPIFLHRVVAVSLPQAALSAVGFAAWALILPGPFASLPWYDAVYGALAFIVVVTLLPVL